MTDYAQGGYVGPRICPHFTGTSCNCFTFVPTKPLMSLASYRALASDMREKLDVEIVITADEARELGAAALLKLGGAEEDDD